MIKKLSLVVMTVFLIVLMGCREDTPVESYTFSMLYNDRESSPYDPDWLVLQEYETRKGVRFDVLLGDDNDYEKDIIMAMESENPPDILLKVWPHQVADYAGRELLLPISEYMDQMPWFSEYIEENDLEGEIDRIRMRDGKFYVLPGFQRAIQVQQWVYRSDLFDSVPTTYDELFTELVILKEQYPESTPLTACWGGAHLYSMMGAGFGVTGGWNGYRSYNEDDSRWEFVPATEAYHEMYRFLNRCFEADLIDLEEFEQGAQEFSERLRSNKSFLVTTWISSGFTSWDDALHDMGIEDARWVPLPVLESPNGVRALPPVDRYRNGLVISSHVKDLPYFDALLEFIDWAVYSPEGRTLSIWGVEGITFEKTESGLRFLPEIHSGNNPEGTVDMKKDLGLNLLFNLVEDEAFEDAKKPEDIMAFLTRSLIAGDTADLDPKLTLSAIQLEAVSQIKGPIEAYAGSAGKRFITGELDIDADWVAYLEELESLGYRALEDFWNSAGGK